jgi:hypothetical protein
VPVCAWLHDGYPLSVTRFRGLGLEQYIARKQAASGRLRHRPVRSKVSGLAQLIRHEVHEDPVVPGVLVLTVMHAPTSAGVSLTSGSQIHHQGVGKSCAWAISATLSPEGEP